MKSSGGQPVGAGLWPAPAARVPRQGQEEGQGQEAGHGAQAPHHQVPRVQGAQ